MYNRAILKRLAKRYLPKPHFDEINFMNLRKFLFIIKSCRIIVRKIIMYVNWCYIVRYAFDQLMIILSTLIKLSCIPSATKFSFAMTPKCIQIYYEIVQQFIHCILHNDMRNIRLCQFNFIASVQTNTVLHLYFLVCNVLHKLAMTL